VAFLLPVEPVPVLYFGTFKPDPSVLYDRVSKGILQDKIARDQYQDQEIRIPHMNTSFSRNTMLCSLIWVLCIALVGCSYYQTPGASLPATEQVSTQNEFWPTKGWKTSTPEEQGMDAQVLTHMQDSIQQQDLRLHSLLIIRNGYIISETYFQSYNQSTRHEIYSCTKSFISSLIGIAIDKGYIDNVNHLVLDFFSENNFKNQDESKKAMTLENLLTMKSGLSWTEQDPMEQSSDWVSFVLVKPMSDQPGSKFNYCSGCSHILSTIIAQTTHMRTQDFARKYVFEPLGISNYYWETDPSGNANGGWGLQLTPRDMAKLGYLYLKQGKWAGQQIISTQWIQTATQKHTDTDQRLGYGYQWWIYPHPGSYAALGVYGQAILVFPKENLIVVTTAGETNHDRIIKLIETYILTAIK
jgi:CubicO group peptidase (beta-lactamase class C family)